MKSKLFFALALIIILITSGFIIYKGFIYKVAPINTGGRHERFYGKCQITSIAPYDSTYYIGQYNVKFNFILSDYLNFFNDKSLIERSGGNIFAGETFNFTKNAGINIPTWFIEKYGIEENKLFGCDALVVKEGYPWIVFDFRNIAENDSSGKDSEIINRAKNPEIEFTIAEFWQHNREDDCWLYIDGKVYDVTDLIAQDLELRVQMVDYCGLLYNDFSEELVSEYYIGDTK